MNFRQKGFTLVELLIVMVVIAVLSAMMLLSSAEVTATSNVAQVLADMKMMEKAVLMCCADNPNKYPNPPYCDPPTMAEVRKYLDNASIITDEGKETNTESAQWFIQIQNKNNTDTTRPPIWYLHYKMPQHMTDSYAFRQKMQDRAKSLTLFWSLESKIDEAKQAGRFYKAMKGESNGNHDPVDIYMPLFM